MNPLDSTAILDRAVGSFLRVSARPAGAGRVEPRITEISRGTGVPSREATAGSHGISQATQPSPDRLRPGLTSLSSAAKTQPHASPAAGNPRALIRDAEEVLQLITISASSAVFRRQIAAAAYLAEIEAQRELAASLREGASGREWFA